MMMRWRSLRRVGLVILCAVIVAGSAPQPAPAQDAIEVVVDGSTVRLDPPPLLIGGRVFVPLRGLFERMGALVEWKPVSRTAIIVRQSIYVELRLNERTIVVNGSPLRVDHPPRLVRGRVYIPLRVVSEAIGGSVTWRAADRTVLIATPAGRPEPGAVTVSVGAAGYTVGQPVIVTVANGTARPIFTQDSKTDCSIVELERTAASGWAAIRGCRLGRKPLIVELKPGERMTATINPKSPHLSESGVPGFAEGTYRLRFAYASLRGLLLVEPNVVFSATFQIRPLEQAATTEPAQPVGGSPPPAGGPPVGDLGEPVAVERGRVTVRLTAAEFPAGTRLQVTVANGLDRTIYSDDFKTDCSIVTLERRVGTGWEPITGCALGRPTMTVPIGTGRGRTVSIDPRSFHLRKAAGVSALAFGPGTYRIRFAYRFTAQPSPESTVYSAPFTIR